MANSLTTNPIVLDTFSSAIDFATQYPTGMRIDSIEWAKPTDTTHTCQILEGGSSGEPIFDEQCTTANQSVIKYYDGAWFKPLYLSAATSTEKASGSIIIVLK